MTGVSRTVSYLNNFIKFPKEGLQYTLKGETSRNHAPFGETSRNHVIQIQKNLAQRLKLKVLQI